MKHSFQLNIIAGSLMAVLLTGCGDAETNIVEKDPIEVIDDHSDHEDEYTIESMGRLAVLSADNNSAVLFDLDAGDLLDTFSLTHSSNTLTYSADYRFAVITSRANDYVGFIDGGLYREDHGAHLHDYQETPTMSDYELFGSRPTHIIKNDGNMIIFNDGDSASGVSASVQVITDANIANESNTLPTLDYTVNMHGVALIKDGYIFSTIRRDDSETTSDGTLPDQVGVYHLHDGDYEQEEILSVNCPDLHGAAQNSEYLVFGCSDGILTAHAHDDEFHAEKIINIDALGDLRVGSIYGHEEVDNFIGVGAAHGGSTAVLVSIHAEHGEMEALEWQPASDASPISYAFSHEGEYFLILDAKGFLNVLAPENHDGETHWELKESIDISAEDLTQMPDGRSFSMTVAQNGHYAYIADPIAKHIIEVNLESGAIVGDIELNFTPEALVWLGIEEEAHEHDDDETEAGHVH